MQRLMVEADRDVASSLIMKTRTVWGWCKPCGKSTACWEAIKSFRCYAHSSRYQHILAPRMCQDCWRVEEAGGQSWKLLDGRLGGLPGRLPATEDTQCVLLVFVGGAERSCTMRVLMTQGRWVPRRLNLCHEAGVPLTSVFMMVSEIVLLLWPTWQAGGALALLHKDQITECRGGIKVSGYCTGTAAQT